MSFRLVIEEVSWVSKPLTHSNFSFTQLWLLLMKIFFSSYFYFILWTKAELRRVNSEPLRFSAADSGVLCLTKGTSCSPSQLPVVQEATGPSSPHASRLGSASSASSAHNRHVTWMNTIRVSMRWPVKKNWQLSLQPRAYIHYYNRLH